MLQLPSLRKPFSEFYSGDDAFVQPPAGATDAMLTAHFQKWTTARETGDFSSLRVGGVQPTEFTFQFFTGDQDRRIRSLATNMNHLYQLAFRCAVVDITNCGDLLLERTQHPQLGLIAAESVTNRFDALNPAVVDELGALALIRGTGHLTPHR